MANYNVINAYDADVRFPQFKGLMQYGDPVNGESRHFKRGVPLEVTVSEFLLLKTKFPTI